MQKHSEEVAEAGAGVWGRGWSAPVGDVDDESRGRRGGRGRRAREGRGRFREREIERRRWVSEGKKRKISDKWALLLVVGIVYEI